MVGSVVVGEVIESKLIGGKRRGGDKLQYVAAGNCGRGRERLVAWRRVASPAMSVSSGGDIMRDRNRRPDRGREQIIAGDRRGGASHDQAGGKSGRAQYRARRNRRQDTGRGPCRTGMSGTSGTRKHSRPRAPMSVLAESSTAFPILRSGNIHFVQRVWFLQWRAESATFIAQKINTLRLHIT